MLTKSNLLVSRVPEHDSQTLFVIYIYRYRYIFIIYREALLSPSVTWLRASVSLSMAPSLSFPLFFENLYRYNEKGCNDNGKKMKAPLL